MCQNHKPLSMPLFGKCTQMFALCLNYICKVLYISYSVLIKPSEPVNVRISNDQCMFTSLIPPSHLCCCRHFSLSCAIHKRAKMLCVILPKSEITHPFVCNGSRIVTVSSEMNPLEMLENENETQSVLISNPCGNLTSLTTICAFEN